MSIEIVGEREGVITITISGKLKQSEHAESQKLITERMGAQGKVSVLVIASNFEGWESSGNWGDLDRQFAMDPMIRKMAIVGDRKWEDLVSMFAGKGMREFPVEYFEPSELAQATAWAKGT